MTAGGNPHDACRQQEKRCAKGHCARLFVKLPQMRRSRRPRSREKLDRAGQMILGGLCGFCLPDSWMSEMATALSPRCVRARMARETWLPYTLQHETCSERAVRCVSLRAHRGLAPTREPRTVPPSQEGKRDTPHRPQLRHSEAA